MATTEHQLQIKGKSGKTYTFFPAYPLSENETPKGAGIYVFVNGKEEIADIQYIKEEDETKDTFRRMQDNGVTTFYFAGTYDRREADQDIDDIKESSDYRRKSD